MNNKRYTVLAIVPVLAGMVWLAGPAGADGPVTLWNFLGIPQGIQKVRDVSVNRRGNRPGLERKDPLKRIADPENMESDNPAIKTAAKIKKEEDLAKQKIKAIKYLATVGCGCYPDVQEALLAALDDCTEEVRKEAAIALCQASGNICDKCQSGCCNAEIMQKLHEMAYGQDEKGCDIEQSAEVRAAARNALNACNRMHRPGDAPIETPKEITPPKEVPIEIPENPAPEVPAPESPAPEAPAPEPAAPQTSAPLAPPIDSPPIPTLAPPKPEPAIEMNIEEVKAEPIELIIPAARNYPSPDNLHRSVSWPTYLESPQAEPIEKLPAEPAVENRSARIIVAPTSFTRRVETGSSRILPVGCRTEVGCCDATGCNGNGYGNGYGNGNGNGAVSDADDGAGTSPSDEAAADALEGPSPDYLASSYGAAAGPQSMAPNMMGDFFGGGIGISSEGHYHSSSSSGTIPLAGGDRRFKISENNNPRPTDRVFFNYNHFHNALFSGVDLRDHHLNRFTFGVEKTFNDGLGSVELRVPFADGLNSVQDFSMQRPVEATEFGDIVLVVKHIIRQRGNRLLTAGLGITFPTGSDASQTFDGETDVLFKNEAVRLQPYLGWLWTPGPCWFVEAFVAADFDTNGHAVLTRDYVADRLVYQGRLHEQSLLYLDASIGRWIYRNPCATCITGIAPTVELHYTTTMEDTDSVGGFSNPFNRMDVLDLTAGVHVQLGARNMLSVAGVAPLRQDEEKLFDAEIQLQYNRYF